MKIYIHRMQPSEQLAIEKSMHGRWVWYFSLGVVLMTLGVLAIGAATLTTFISIIVCGALLMAACVVTLIHSTQFWRKSWGQFFLHLALGILYGIASVLLLMRPMLGAVTLTFALSLLYLFLGVSRIAIAISTRPLKGWVWMLINGIISVILGGIILINWPTISLWIIGLFVGIDLVFVGWWLTLLGWLAVQHSAVEKG